MDVMVLNSNFDIIYVIDTYESLLWIDRLDSYGDFELYFSMDQNLLFYLVPDNYLVINQSEHCMIIETIEVKSDVEYGDKLIVTGRSLESILDRRILWGQSIFSGNLQNSIKKMIDDSIINPTDENRKISNFKFVESHDPIITELEGDYQFFGDNLYSVISNICQINALGFKVILNQNKEFEFSLYAGTDRSYYQDVNPYVVFSNEYDNIIYSDFYETRSDYKNVCLVGGEGEGSERKTASIGESIGLERREIFVEAGYISTITEEGTLSDEDYNKQLIERGNEQLTSYSEYSSFNGEVESRNTMYKYGVDYFIGDIVQLEDKYGNVGTSYVSSVIISHSLSELSIYPTFTSI